MAGDKLTTCFWCGKLVSKGIYTPCPVCRAIFEKGILLIGVSKKPKDNRPAIKDGYYPTGNYAVISEKYAKKILPHAEAESLHNKNAIFVSNAFLTELWKRNPNRKK